MKVREKEEKEKREMKRRRKKITFIVIYTLLMLETVIVLDFLLFFTKLNQINTQKKEKKITYPHASFFSFLYIILPLRKSHNNVWCSSVSIH
jgi:flagellar basal body-associated protein FliL